MQVFENVNTIKKTFELIADDTYDNHKLRHGLTKEALNRTSYFLYDYMHFLDEDALFSEVAPYEDIAFKVNKLLHQDNMYNNLDVGVAWNLIGEFFSLFNKELV